MKNGWVTRPLVEVCTLRNGRAYKKPELLEKGKYRVLRVGNFFTNNHWYYSDLELDDTKYCDEGDLLYAWSASFGPRIWEGEKVIYHYHIWRVDFDDQLIDKKFLFYWFVWDAASIKKDQGAGTTMIHVSMTSMNARLIDVPPLVEQKRIVAILDEAFAGIDTAIANTEKNLANACELFESYLNSVFTKQGEGWFETKLGKEINLLTGFAFKSKEYSNSPDSVNLLRGDNIVQGKFRWQDVKKWPKDDTDTYEKYFLKEGDVVLAMDRTWIKAGLKYAQVSSKDLPCLLVQRVARLRAEKNLDSRYLKYLLGSVEFTRYVLSIQTGLGVPHISGKQISDFQFNCPPIDEQRLLVDVFDEFNSNVDRLLLVYEQKLTSLYELKQSLLQKAFSGELTAEVDKLKEEAVA